MSGLVRVRGVRRIEREYGCGWIARDQCGGEIGGKGFRWNSRCSAWHAAADADSFGPFPAQPPTKEPTP